MRYRAHPWPTPVAYLRYCSKPERYFYMESERNGVKYWLKARTIGLCSTYNRLMCFKPVRGIFGG